MHPETPPVGGPIASDRYEDRGLVAVGGMGEIRRVYDRDLGRTVVLKLLRVDLAGDRDLVDRFLGEAQLTARLSHPSIVPVHDVGALDDGRFYFAMKEVTGRTLAVVIEDLRAHRVTLRRVVEGFHRACEGVASTHARRIVHRDLKPDNIMIGEFGEVLVMDWGLARDLNEPLDPGPREGLSGTPGFMPPEQVAGQLTDERGDVYSLGMILAEILGCRVTARGYDRATLRGPEELVRLVVESTRALPELRPRSGQEFATALANWLDGVQRRSAGLELVERADAILPEAESLRARAAELEAEAEAALRLVRRWEPEEAKADAWAVADEARALREKAELLDIEADGLLRGALAQAPDLDDAHARLLRRAQADLERAEILRDHAGIARARARMREHVEALDADHPASRAATALLTADGTLDLETDAPDAEIELLRYITRNRRMVAEPLGTAPAPLHDLRLDPGSYLLVARAPGREPARYPVFLRHGQRWEATGPAALELLPAGSLGPDDAYVPGGPAFFGDDPQEERVPGFVIRRFPVTNREYLAFLDALHARGDDAAAFAPREAAGASGEAGPVLYGRDADGRFVLAPDSEGDTWDPDWPVIMVDFACAEAYAAWLAEATGLPWRLPSAREAEKAARGVDARVWPWGDFADPSWCHMTESHRGRRTPTIVDSYPVDCSPYAVRGLAGNVSCWCADDRSAGPDAPRRATHGGHWYADERECRSARRPAYPPMVRTAGIGIRVARSLPRRLRRR